MQNKTDGVDNINVKTINVMSDCIVEPLAYVFNLCMERPVQPNILKKVVVIPPGRCRASTYRPISLIFNFAKIFYDRIYIFVCFINPRQFGFVKGRETKEMPQLYNKFNLQEPG